MRRSRLRRAVHLVLVGAREVASALMEAAETVDAEMAAFDSGVDTSAVRPEDLPSSRRTASVRRESDGDQYLGGPFRRRGPLDDETPVSL